MYHKTLRLVTLLIFLATGMVASRAFATANYVYHERTVNDVSGGEANTCGGVRPYVPVLIPAWDQAYLLRFKVEYAFYTDNLRIYYTTDGSNPSGALGGGLGTTLVLNGTYDCTFTSSPNTIDVCSATIPAQPVGTVVKYIISAWHSGGGPEIFANSGEFSSPFTTAAQATVFTYTVTRATRYWDINGATPDASAGATAAGTWDTGINANWSTDSTGASATGMWFANDDAVFSAGANASGSFTVTIPTGTTNFANSVTVQEGTILLGPGTLSFGAANGIFDVSSGATMNISGAGSGLITGTGGITKNGPGLLFLGSSEAYTNTVGTGAMLTVNDGTADFSGDTALGVLPAVARSNAVTLNGGTLRYSGGAALTLNLNRGVTIGPAGGTIEVTNSAITGLSLPSAAAFTLNGGPTAVLTKTGPGRFTLNTTSTSYKGKYRVLAGTLNSAGDGRFGDTPASVVADYFFVDGGALRSAVTTAQAWNANRGITVGAGGCTLMQPGANAATLTDTLTYNGIIAGTAGGNLTISTTDAAGGGTADGFVILGGANTYNGNTTVNTGVTLRFGAAGVIPDGSVVTVTGFLDLNGFNETIGGLGGAGNVTNGVAGTRTLTVNQPDDQTFSGILRTGTGDLNLVKQGAGVLTLSAANTYTGTTTIETGGAIKITALNRLGGSAAGQGTTVNSGGQLQIAGTGTFSEPLTLNGTGINNDGTGAFVITANGPTLSGGITLGSSGVRLQNNASAATVSSAISGSGFDLLMGGTAGWTVTTVGINIGGGTLTKDGAGILRLDTANTIGAINFNGGGLNVGNAGCFGAATITVGSGVGTPTDTGGFLAGSTLGLLNINNDIVLNTGAICGLAPAAGGTILNFAGTISGNGALRRTRLSGTGAGTVMLSGANNFNGGVVHATDILVLNNKAALGTGTYTIGSAIFPASSQVPNISANIALIGVDAVINPIIINTNVFTWSGSSALEFSGDVTLAATPTITVSSTAASILSGDISGSGFGLTKIGTGTLTLSGNNTYDGSTLVTNGTLLVHGSLAGPVTATNGGTLGGNGSIGGIVTVQTGGTLAPGASVGTLTLATSPTLAGTTAMEISKSGVTLTNDKIVLTTGTLSYGGALVVTLTLGSDALKGGDSFDLFDAAAFADSFATVSLPILPIGLSWVTSQLAVDGSISVACAFSPVADAGTNHITCSGVGVQIGGTPTASGGSGGYTYSWTPATGLSSATDANPTATPAATTIYTVTVTDGNGCVSVGDSVTVSVDTVAPVITCPTDLTVECDADVPAPDFAGGSVSDALDPNPVVTHVSDVPVGTNPKIITRTYEATDACSNTLTCVQTITVQDTIVPIASCTNISIILVGGVASITPADVNNGSSDNCALNLVSVEPNTFYSSNAGPNNVTLTVSDNAEHTNTCVAVVTVIDIVLETNRYVLTAADLATGKPQFSQPHGTGTNAFGYDWDSAAPADAFGAPAGYGDSSFFASVTNDNTGAGPDVDAYRTFRIGLRSLFGMNVTVGQVARISYKTRKPTAQSAVDWRLTIYTTREDLNPGNNGSFYRSRLQSTPGNALSLNAPAGQWNGWSTLAGDNQFQFKDNRAGFGSEDMLWSEIIAGPVTRGDTWNWTAEEVMMIDITMGANTGGGSGLSQLDAVEITLTTGQTAEIDLQQNTVLTRYDIEPTELATGKPQFSPPHGTGTNPFGYDWDSAAPDTADGAPTGYGCSSYSANVTQAGATQPDRYRTFRIGLRTLFGRNVTVGEVASITYQTEKSTPQTAVDWRLTIYTTREDLNPGNNGSFYRSRLQSTPSNALNLNAPAGQWNVWGTPSGANQFQFKDNRSTFGTEDMLWSEIVSGSVTRGANTWDWTAEEVMMIDITLGANSGGGDAISQLDAVQIRLSDGTIADLNLDSLPYSTVYVDDDYTGLLAGTSVTFPNGGGGPSHVIGCDAFATIQDAINAVTTLGAVNVAPGNYHEDVLVNKTVSVLGAGAGQSVVYGVMNGSSATFQIAAAGVLLEGLTITRDGNNPTDWNGPLNSAGVAIQGLAVNATVRNCWLEGNRTAIDINLGAGNVIANNVLTNNRTGIIFRNDCQNNTLTNNAIVDNWTVGVLWLDTGISGLAQGTVLRGNNISGNWYGQIVDRRVTPTTFDVWNCSGNWLGSSTLVITSANSTEPGYAAQIPVAFGGSAVAPGGAPTLAGPGVANIDYTPWLDVGTDTSVASGFQGNFATLHVDDDSPQAGSDGRIQEGVNSVSGSTVLIAAGAYSENIVISSNVTLIGAGSGTGGGDTIITAANASLPVILIDDAGGVSAGDRLTIQNLRVQGSTGADGIRLRATTAARAFYRFDNVASVLNSNGAGLGVQGPQNVSDIEVNNCLLNNNNYGLRLDTSIPVFSTLSLTGGEIKDNSTLGLTINPNGTDATDASTDFSNITVDGTTFANNGNAIFAGSGHLSFFRFNGNATVKNVTLSGPTWSPVQFRGEGVDANPGTWQPIGTVLLQNVIIGGSGIRPGLYIQDYSNVTGFTFDNVNLGTYLPPDVSGPNGFSAQAMQVRHTGAAKINLGKLTLPCTVTFSGFTPTSGFYALAMSAPGGAQATCDTVILGAATTQALEDCVFDANDTALMAALSLPPGSIGDVAFPALSVSCPLDVVQGCAGPGGAVVTFPAASATGDCTPGLPSCLPASGSTFPPGTTVVTCSVTDARGITASCNFNVTVLLDTNPPAINCPAAIVVSADSGACAKSNITYTVTATDNCDTNLSIVSTPASGSTFPVGTTTVTSVATDDFGNTNTCSFTVTVTDDQAPNIICPTNIVTDNDSDLCGAVVSFTPTATDNCAVTNLTSTPASGSVFPVGTTTVTNVATDASGNSMTCTFTVTVNDVELPTIACPTNVTVAANPGTCSATNVSLGNPATDDNCGVDSFTNNAPAVYSIGSTPVIWTVIDVHGNINSCTQLVTVVDTQVPVITCSTNRFVEASGPTGTPVFFSTAATDNCGIPTTFCSMSSGDPFPLGLTTVFCGAFDASFNASACSFNVTVVDTIAPVITCPTNLTLGCNRTNGAVVDFTVIATDIADASVTVISTPPSGSLFVPGTTIVNATAYDDSGNTNTCSFTITVAEAPIVLSVRRVGTNAVVKWPVTCTSYVLEESGNLNEPVAWMLNGSPVVVDTNFQNVVTTPHGNTNRFFRLRYP